MPRVIFGSASLSKGLAGVGLGPSGRTALAAGICLCMASLGGSSMPDGSLRQTVTNASRPMERAIPHAPSRLPVTANAMLRRRRSNSRRGRVIRTGPTMTRMMADPIELLRMAGTRLMEFAGLRSEPAPVAVPKPAEPSKPLGPPRLLDAVYGPPAPQPAASGYVGGWCFNARDDGRCAALGPREPDTPPPPYPGPWREAGSTAHPAG